MDTSLIELDSHHIPELCHDISVKQFSEIGRGGQFKVLVLTDPELSQPSTPDLDYIVPRVAKISLNSLETAFFVRDEIHIADPVEQAEKIAELYIARHITFNAIMAIAALRGRSSLLTYNLGGPAPIRARRAPRLPVGHFDTGPAYSQDYNQPVQTFLERLQFDERNLLHRRIGIHIVNQYIRLQPHLCRVSMFDTSYKVADNYGIDQECTLGVNDFSEFAQAYTQAKESIATREWEQLPKREESHSLPPYLHGYFCDMMRRHVTPQMLLRNWGKTHIPDFKREPEVLSSLFDFRGTKLLRNSPRPPRVDNSSATTGISADVGYMAHRLVRAQA